MKQLSPGGLVVWLVACMLAIIIIALDVCVNTLRIVNYGEADTVNKDRKSELLIELGIVLLIAALLTGREKPDTLERRIKYQKKRSSSKFGVEE